MPILIHWFWAQSQFVNASPTPHKRAFEACHNDEGSRKQKNAFVIYVYRVIQKMSWKFLKDRKDVIIEMISLSEESILKWL